MRIRTPLTTMGWLVLVIVLFLVGVTLYFILSTYR